MADTVCVTATQRGDSIYNATVRRSLNLSRGASVLVRRFSRSSSGQRRRQQQREEETATGSIVMRRSTNSTPAISSECLVATRMHLRIVPSIDDPSRSLIFDIVDRELEHGIVVKVGRFTDRSRSPNHMSFRSKVVSRAHCEFWLGANGKLYLRDTKSSSGTFLNHIRLSPSNQESQSVEVKDGDIVQLGVDYQDGQEDIYRCVKMRFELNRTRTDRPLSFNMNAFHQVRSLATAAHPPAEMPPNATSTQEARLDLDTLQGKKHGEALVTTHVEECCICLYAMAPFQALFVAPCSHSYHYKCIRPLLQSHPGFQCPICRTYSDLEASVAVEMDEVMKIYGVNRLSTGMNSLCQTQMMVDPVTEENFSSLDQGTSSKCQAPHEEEHIDDEDVRKIEGKTDNEGDDSRQQQGQRRRELGQKSDTQSPIPGNAFIEEATSSSMCHYVPTIVPEQCLRDVLSATLVSPACNFHSILSNESEASQDSSSGVAHAQYRLAHTDDLAHHIATTPPLVGFSEEIPADTQQRRRLGSERRKSATAGLMEKLKTVLFEKRKSTTLTRERERKRRPSTTQLHQEERERMSPEVSSGSATLRGGQRCQSSSST